MKESQNGNSPGLNTDTCNYWREITCRSSVFALVWLLLAIVCTIKLCSFHSLGKILRHYYKPTVNNGMITKTPEKKAKEERKM